MVCKRGRDGRGLLLAEVDVPADGLHVEGNVGLRGVGVELMHIGDMLRQLQVGLTVGSVIKIHDSSTPGYGKPGH